MTRRAAPGGVAYSCDCYRTIGGERYVAWTSCEAQAKAREYRRADVRCRREGEELFVHVDDQQRAAQLDGGQEGALTRCAAGRDGECGHKACPQLRDNEPAKSGRHCPLDQEGIES